VVEDVRDVVPPVDGPDLQLSIDSKVQFFAYQKLRDAVQAHKAKAGSVVVLDTQTGEVLALANYPSYNPNRRQNLSGEQLRNRALTDSFEPGSTMKPFVAALALDKGWSSPTTPSRPRPGASPSVAPPFRDAKDYGVLSVNEVIQKSSNVGTVKMAMQMSPRDMWESYAQAGFGQKPQVPFPGGGQRPPAALQDLAPHRAGHHELRLRPVGLAVPAGAGLHRVRARRRTHSGHHDQDRRARWRACACSAGRMRWRCAGCCTWRRPGRHRHPAQTMGYSVGGKTGTARKQEGKGYADRKYRSFFVGLAPVDQPRASWWR
jgi:cell division protein FtsI (penicillin-binding protein 3)